MAACVLCDVVGGGGMTALFPLPTGLSCSVHQTRCLGRAGAGDGRFTYDLSDVHGLVQRSWRAGPCRTHGSHSQEELVSQGQVPQGLLGHHHGPGIHGHPLRGWGRRGCEALAWESWAPCSAGLPFSLVIGEADLPLWAYFPSLPFPASHFQTALKTPDIRALTVGQRCGR